MKVKFFRNLRDIQPFLDENHNIKIKFIKQSSASDGYGNDLMELETIVSIWYEV